MSAPAIHTSRMAAHRLPGGSPKVNFYAAGLLRRGGGGGAATPRSRMRRSEERRVGKECVTTCRYVTGVQTCALPISQIAGRVAKGQLLRGRSPPPGRRRRRRDAEVADEEIGRASCRERVCNDVSLRDWSSDVCSSDLTDCRAGRQRSTSTRPVSSAGEAAAAPRRRGRG